jgi:hypothetical protein
LSGVVSVHMEEISLSIFQYASYGIDIDVPHNRIVMEWGDVDTILARQQFSNLNSVSVRHTQYASSTEYPLEWFFDRLPLCHKRAFFVCTKQIHGAPHGQLVSRYPLFHEDTSTVHMTDSRRTV